MVGGGTCTNIEPSVTYSQFKYESEECLLKTHTRHKNGRVERTAPMTTANVYIAASRSLFNVPVEYGPVKIIRRHVERRQRRVGARLLA